MYVPDQPIVDCQVKWLEFCNNGCMNSQLKKRLVIMVTCTCALNFGCNGISTMVCDKRKTFFGCYFAQVICTCNCCCGMFLSLTISCTVQVLFHICSQRNI